MEAIILAGGLGTRLQQTVPLVPKALAPIQGVPFLEILLQQFEESGLFSKVILALGHKAPQIQETIDKDYRFALIHSIEPFPLGTGGAILHALDQVEGQTVFICNGDSYTDLSFSSFFAFHREKQAQVSIACREVEDASRFGSLSFDETFRIHRFIEKSPHPVPGWISCGLYLIEKQLLSSFSKGSYSLEKDFFPQFLSQKMFAFLHQGAFIDIGTKESYEQAQHYLEPWIHPS